MKILVTGGAGYIGSFMTRRLLEKGYEVVVFDSLERGSKNNVPEEATFVSGDIGDKNILDQTFSDHKIDGVIHFAAYISMKESMHNPHMYFENNTYKSMVLLEKMHQHNIDNMIFSSTAGVYGNPSQIPIPEDHQKNPTNPYGESKLMFEKILAWYNAVYGISYTVLRYFNACGASLDGNFGEAHDPETHIIPCAMKALLENRAFELFGTNYETFDGTCVRDYIHVLDLAEAHVLALEKIVATKGSYTFNVGTGKGYSNRQVLESIERISGKKLEIHEKERRPGDANELVADVSRINQELGFAPKYSDIDTIVESAWKWHTREI